MSVPEPHVVRRGSGIPLIFVHGNGVDHRLLLDLDDVFAENGQWERIYLDLPGFGATPPLPGRGGLPELADWLDHAVQELVGSEPFALLGNSMGGLLARDLAARRTRQCLGIALLAPVVDPVHIRRTLPATTVVHEDADLLATLDAADAEAYEDVAVVQSPENWERFRRHALPGTRAADEDAMQRIGERYELSPPPDEGLEGFDGPVVIVVGKQDAIVGYEDQASLSRRFPHSTYTALDRAGHNVHLDRPDAVRALLGDWAAAIGKNRGAHRSVVRALEPSRDFASPFHSQGTMAVGAERTAFVSGQVGVRPNGEIGHGVAEQTRIAMENIARVLDEGALALADIVSLRVYLTRHDHIGDFVEAARPFVGDPRPASTLLVIPSLSNPELLVQIEAVAAG